MLLFSLFLVKMCIVSATSDTCDHMGNLNQDCLIAANVSAESLSDSVRVSFGSVMHSIKGNEMMRELRSKFHTSFSVSGGLLTAYASVALLAMLLISACCCRMHPFARFVLLAVCIVGVVLLDAVVF